MSCVKERVSGGCECGQVEYSVPNLPIEIAQCHCSICQTLHQTKFVPFAKYKRQEIRMKSKKYLLAYSSSNRARRFYCSGCKTWMFMKYKNSLQIWIVVDTLQADTSGIDRYDIFL